MKIDASEFLVLIFRERNSFSRLQLKRILLHQILIHNNFCRGESWSSDEVQGRVTNKFPRKPQERLLEVVVGFGRDFKILQVLFSMEGHRACLHFPLLDINFVPAKNNGNLFTNTLQIAVPIWYVFVGNSRCHVEHDDTTLALNVVSITESSKLLLAGCVPDVETDGTEVG